jgi:hypothetical protein
MSQDGLKFSEIKVVHNSSDSLWVDYGNFVKEISSHTDAKKIRRFRRLIPPERIVMLADMLHSLLSKNNKE